MAGKKTKPESSDFPLLRGHMVARTSPIGSPFIGKCLVCNREGMTPAETSELDCIPITEKTWADNFNRIARGSESML